MKLMLANLAAMLVLPFVLHGVVNRVKSLWSGRKGPPILQLAFDVLRLVRKRSVYSSTTSGLFRVAPYVLLATAVSSASVTPLLGVAPISSFSYDFVWLAYLAGLGRVAVLLAALDTGSSFEGMGAAREATFATLIEPAFFLVMGALCLVSGAHTLQGALSVRVDSGAELVLWIAALVTLLIALQVEAARVPVDDPATHLELTMIHEVMVLDHSGPDLAAIQVASALKLLVGSSMIATLMNPWLGRGPGWAMVGNVALCLGVAVTVGTIESLVARLRMRAVPQYLAVALASGAVALLAAVWRLGGAS
jgi:formate hydrogenlyase subunit 4